MSVYLVNENPGGNSAPSSSLTGSAVGSNVWVGVGAGVGVFVESIIAVGWGVFCWVGCVGGAVQPSNKPPHITNANKFLFVTEIMAI